MIQLQDLDNLYIQIIQNTYTVDWVDFEKKIYNPIPDIEIPITSNSVIIGINCPKAYKEWRLAAYASIQARINFNTIFGQWVDLKTEVLLIQRLTLLESPFMGFSEFRLKLKIPHWHEEVYLEAWEQE